MFKEVFQARLKLVNPDNTSEDTAILLYNPNSDPPGELERNFFKLLHFLSKNCPKNNDGLKSIRTVLERYSLTIKQENSGQGRQDIIKKIEAIIKEIY